MFDVDECDCEKQCSECEDCFVAKCQCECDIEAGLKEIPDENDIDEVDDNDEETEEVEEKREKSLEAEELGIRVEDEERLPEY